jgi:hypothetical protein
MHPFDLIETLVEITLDENMPEAIARQPYLALLFETLRPHQQVEATSTRLN